MCIVWDCPGFIHEFLIYLIEFRLDFGKFILYSFAFIYQSLSCIRIKLSFHLLRIFIPLCPECLCLLHQSRALILICQNLVKIDIHEAILDILPDFFGTSLQFSYINHLYLSP